MTEHVRARHRAPAKAVTPLTPVTGAISVTVTNATSAIVDTMTNTVRPGLQQAAGNGVEVFGRGGAVIAVSSGLVAATALTSGAVLDATSGFDPAAAELASGSLITVGESGTTVSRGGASDAASVGERAATTRSAALAAERASRSSKAQDKAKQARVTNAARSNALAAAGKVAETPKATATTASAKKASASTRSASVKSTTKTTTKTTAKTTTKAAAAPAPVARGSGVLAIASRYVGIPYRYGGTTPAGFDCSGFTQYVFKQVGVSLPRTAQQQMNAATRIPRSQAKPGDLVFVVSSGGGSTGHVGIYAGGNMMYDSPRSGKSISKRAIWTSSVAFGRVA